MHAVVVRRPPAVKQQSTVKVVTVWVVSIASMYSSPLFWCVFFGGLCPLLVPLSLSLRHQGYDETLCTAMVYVSAFVFFLFSTVPKIGFATLMQSLAQQADASGRIFGFVSTVITAMDSLVLMGVSAVRRFFLSACLFASACMCVHLMVFAAIASCHVFVSCVT